MFVQSNEVVVFKIFCIGICPQRLIIRIFREINGKKNIESNSALTRILSVGFVAYFNLNLDDIEKMQNKIEIKIVNFDEFFLKKNIL